MFLNKFLAVAYTTLTVGVVSITQTFLSRWDIEERTRINGFDFDIFTLVSAGTEHCENTQYCDDDDDSFIASDGSDCEPDEDFEAEEDDTDDEYVDDTDDDE